jgi:hypothetical protein
MVYFAVFLAVYMETAEYALINSLLNITIHGWLAFVMLVSAHHPVCVNPCGPSPFNDILLMETLILPRQLSVAARYPWALQHAKEASPQIAWDAPSFRAVVDHVAGVWGASQAVTALLCIVRSVELYPLLSPHRWD